MSAVRWVLTVLAAGEAMVLIGAIIYAIAPTKAGRSDRARQAGLRAVERELRGKS